MRLRGAKAGSETQMRSRLALWVVVLAAFVTLSASSIQGASPTGTIEGRIAVIRGGGDVVPGARVPLWLHARGIDVQGIIRKHRTDSGSEALQKLAILTMILEFTKLLDSQEYRKYQVATTTANFDGEFRFSGLPTGRWYYVTAIYETNFSTVIWHMPVALQSYSRVELSNDNAALPIYNR